MPVPDLHRAVNDGVILPAMCSGANMNTFIIYPFPLSRQLLILSFFY